MFCTLSVRNINLIHMNSRTLAKMKDRKRERKEREKIKKYREKKHAHKQTNTFIELEGINNMKDER